MTLLHKKLRRGERREYAEIAEKLQAVGHSHDTVTHLRDMKIQKISKLEAAEPQIAQQLAAMDWQDRFNRLELDHDKALNNQVGSMIKAL
jgi:hypothetical protein